MAVNITNIMLCILKNVEYCYCDRVPSDTDAAVSSHILDSTILGVVLGVSLTLLLFVFLAMILYKPGRRLVFDVLYESITKYHTECVCYWFLWMSAGTAHGNIFTVYLLLSRDSAVS